MWLSRPVVRWRGCSSSCRRCSCSRSACSRWSGSRGRQRRERPTNDCKLWKAFGRIIFSLHSQLETYVYSMSLPKDGYPNENRPKWHLQDDIDKNAPNVDIATDLFGLLAPSGVHVNRRRLYQENTSSSAWSQRHTLQSCKKECNDEQLSLIKIFFVMNMQNWLFSNSVSFCKRNRTNILINTR